MKQSATVQSESLADGSTVFHVMLNGEPIAHPQTEESANNIAEKFNSQEKKFIELERSIAAVREWLVKHASKIVDVEFYSYGWDPEIKFNRYQRDDVDPQAIARRFGCEGWERVADGYSCGTFHWVKTVDGVRLIIESAENMKQTIKKEVRIFPKAA
jgi:hypothetical protein